MGLWKDRIDAEIGVVSWNKRAVFEKIQKQKRRPTWLSIPITFAAAIAIFVLLLNINQPQEVKETTASSLREAMESQKVVSYYYSAFDPQHNYNFMGGLDTTYLGMKKGEMLEEMQLYLTDLELSDRKYYGYGTGIDVVVHLEDDSVYKLRMSGREIIDVDAHEVYYAEHMMYYSIFRGELDRGYAINKWFNAIFLILIAMNLILLKLIKQPLKEKIKPFLLHVGGLIVLWRLIILSLEGHMMITKQLMLAVLIVYIIVHIGSLFAWKPTGRLIRFEVYKMLLYIGALLVVWNKFFF